jgi:hypothetical protein
MANKVYIAPETTVVFKASGGDVTITCTSLANNAGRVSAQWDRGSGSKPQQYRWECEFKCVATPTVGQTVSLYWATAQADATVVDGNVGQVDAALSALDKRRNLQFIDVVEVDVASTAIQKKSGTCFIDSRYNSLVPINETGAAFSATAGDFVFKLTPIPPEIQ